MKNILIVDDNKAVRDTLTAYFNFALEGYNMLTAENGQTAIEVLESKPVSLILTDLEMPKADGYQLLEYAKKYYPSIPVIAMTGAWSPDIEVLARELGAARCIEKPFRFKELAQMVHELLGKDDEETSTVIASGRWGRGAEGHAAVSYESPRVVQDKSSSLPHDDK